MKNYFTIFLFLLVGFDSFAQDKIVFPLDRQIFQRDSNNVARFSILGNCSDSIKSVYFSLDTLKENQGIPIEWTLLDNLPQGGIFQGDIEVSGGWYKLKLRLNYKAGGFKELQLDHVGVGEVFIIAGQSNAQGTTRFELDGFSSDDRVNGVNFNSYALESEFSNSQFLGKNNHDYPFVQFNQLNELANIGPMGLSKYYWPELGDSLVKKLNVPICFLNVGFSGTSVINWAESSAGMITKSLWVDAYYESGAPYNALKNTSEIFVRSMGARAILWIQGEADNLWNISANNYKKYLYQLIENYRENEQIDIPWVLAQSTIYFYNENGECVLPNDYSNEINQTLLNIPLENKFPHIYQGPNTDSIEIPRKPGAIYECVHFSKESFPDLTKAWLAKLDSNFFKQANKPYQSNLIPGIKQYCQNLDSIRTVIDNPMIRLDWRKSGKIVSTLGSVNMPINSKVKLNFRDFYFNKLALDSIVNSAYINPVIPSLNITKNQTLCDGKILTVSVTNSKEGYSYFWNDGNKGINNSIESAGTYQVRSRDSLLCYSDPSENLVVEVLPTPPKPEYLLTGALNFCEGDQLLVNLVEPNLNYTWNNGLKDSQIEIAESGEYFVYSTNQFGCLSPNSDTIKTTKFNRPSDPQLSQIGPYQLAVLNSSNNDRYNWYYNDLLLNDEKEDELKVYQNGKYSVEGTIFYAEPKLNCVSLNKKNLQVILPENQSFIVYSNPVLKGQPIKIQSEYDLSGYNLEILDLSGRLIYQTTIKEDKILEISPDYLSAGKYFIRVSNNKNLFSNTVIIQ